MIMYIFDHNKDAWEFCKEYASDAAQFAFLCAGFMAIDGYDVVVVNTSNSHFEYFWGL